LPRSNIRVERVMGLAMARQQADAALRRKEK
jgi:hypothetical protein